MKQHRAWAIIVTLAIGIGCARNRPFASMQISVRTPWEGYPPEHVVQVQFSKDHGCVVAPPELRVLLNGEPLVMRYAGKALSPPTAYGGMYSRCEPALFQSRPFGAGLPAVRERVEVELGNSRAYVEIEGLRAERAPGLISGESLVPGQATTLEWLPRTDVWPERHFDEEVRFKGEDGVKLTVARPALRVEGGRFQFVMPAMRPGPIAVSVSAGPAGPAARVAACHGFMECITSEFSDTSSIHTQVKVPDVAPR